MSEDREDSIVAEGSDFLVTSATGRVLFEGPPGVGISLPPPVLSQTEEDELEDEDAT